MQRPDPETLTLQHTAFETTRRTIDEIAADPDTFCVMVSKELTQIHSEIHQKCAVDNMILRSVTVDWLKLTAAEDPAGGGDPASEQKRGFFRIVAVRAPDNAPMKDYLNPVPEPSRIILATQF